MGSVADQQAPTLAVPAAVALGWISAGLLNLIVGLLVQDSGAASSGIRVVAHAIDLGRHVGAGVLSGVVAWGWVRFGPKHPRAALIALSAAAVLAGVLIMSEDAAGFAGRTSEKTGLPAAVLGPVAIAGASLAVPAAWTFARRLGGARIGLAAVLSATAVVYWLNTKLWQQDNLGLHFFMSWIVAAALGGLVRQRVEDGAGARLLARASALPPGARRGLVAVLVTWAFFSTVPAPSNSAKIYLSGWSSNLLAFSVSGRVSGVPTAGAPELTADQRGFFETRAGGPSVAPTTPKLIEGTPIVIVLTVDALRYDVVADDKYAEYVPNIRALRDAGLDFTEARTPGAQTVVTLSTMSTGKYFSQLYWEKYKTDTWLNADESTHFAEVVHKAGVETIVIPGARWLSENYGILRGFARGKYKKTKHKWTHANTSTKRLKGALKKYYKRGPLVMYCHFFDPHAPYNRGDAPDDAEPFDRYLSEVALVDAKIGEFVAQIDELDIWDRTVLVISADHGEAFGEHGVKHRHSVNLYDELIHVPLIIKGAGIEPGSVSQLVSLIDLGPTIMDIFGVDTPADFMGQSLVPLLQGRDVTLTRPIAAEGRLKQAMVFPNGTKVVVDQRKKTVEVYDLTSDPGEEKNLSDDIDLSTSNEYRMLQQFFDVHTLEREGYSPPYRK